MCGGVQKERMEPENTCVLSGDGTILSLPSRKPYPHKPTYETSNAGAGIHGHGIEYFLVTMINLMSKEFQIKAYPKTTAVLVPNHVWRAGEDSNKVEKHLSATHETAGTKGDIKILQSQVQDDLKQGVAGAVPIPPSDAGKEEVIAALVANVDAMIKGHIWRTGFESNELEGEVFDDVPEALEKLTQRLIFGNSKYGDLRKYLSRFFDSAMGKKRKTRSYVEITVLVGPSEILLITDVYQEAIAAKAAARKWTPSGESWLQDDQFFCRNLKANIIL
ncbi:hypothetical protein CUMW_107280 [Citrus unshiu]|uniref:Uncharacterized protein n=1 Tax=Citrus unshiu TaxID=55188 RepID=A0A2H5P607_CITUN|nr:hypothetical protein CUMW_107280 [Citrus unshiu]